MATSKLLAERFVLDINGIALGIWETARLLDDEETKEKGERKLERLRRRLESYQMRPFLSDNLRIFLKKEFDPDPFYSLLDRLGHSHYQDLLPDIKCLVSTTQEFINDSRRTRASFIRSI